MRKISYLIILVVGLIATSCIKDLDVMPIDPNISTANVLFNSPEAYKEALAKIYAGYALSGQKGGGGGDPDIRGIDEGFSNYLRLYWEMQELSTDEAIIAWDDATIKNFHYQTWDANDGFISAMYSRIFFNISVANEFIRTANTGLETADANLAADIKMFKAEARFLRAFSYWHAMDLFGNVSFVTENDAPGSFQPKRIERAELFKFIEGELLDLVDDLAEPGTQEYGRVDKAAAWMLLAKIYLNAEVYTGTERYTDALTYINKVISSGYSLDPNYARIFRADNNNSPEIIFPICFDGLNTQQYGGTTFIIHAATGADIPIDSLGVDGGWGGTRTTQNFVKLFNFTESDLVNGGGGFLNIADPRAMFFFNANTGWSWTIQNVATYTDGIGVVKFRNVRADGSAAPNAHATFTSTDFPMFRLADAYLMYAEAVLRGGQGGDVNTAVSYVNALRERAFGDASQNITAGNLTLDFILDERGRELYWETHRRTDLIRFGKFTGSSYLWEWKGNTQAGAATEDFRTLYPIPNNDLNSNTNLVQNPGYN